jgi:hypothetical protein
MEGFSMELTQTNAKPPSSGFNKIFGSISVPALGILLLLEVALQFRRSAGDFDPLFLGAAAMGVAAVGLSYYAFRRAINQLDGKIDEKVLSRLLVAANSMANFGYTSCISLFVLLGRR